MKHDKRMGRFLNGGAPIEERFWPKVKKSPTCWLWLGATAGAGDYGYVRFQGKACRAHRVAWALTHGPIPNGMCVLHKCDVPQCVNPDHLFLGTYADNTADALKKGRMPYGERSCAAKLTEDNVRFIRASDMNGSALSKLFGVAHQQISRIKNGQRWKHIAALVLATLMGCFHGPAAEAGVLEIVCVAPLQDNDSGTCDSVVAIPRVGPLWVHLQWQSTVRGGAAGHDSLTAAGGDTLSFVRWISAGEYRTSLWASDAGGIGCAFDTVRTVRGWPGRVRVLK